MAATAVVTSAVTECWLGPVAVAQTGRPEPGLSSTRGAGATRRYSARILASSPPRVDVKYLLRYPEFEEFRTKARQPTATGWSAAGEVDPATSPVPAVEPEQNPEELLYQTYESLRRAVEADILDRLQSESFAWQAFEDLVVDLLDAMGYDSGTEETSRRVTKRTGDDGIDGVIDEDKPGLDAVYIQAKKYSAKTPVGRHALQGFAGSLEGQRASKGVFITTSHFTSDAEDYVRRISRRIRLIDGRELARLMYDYDVGVRSGRSLVVKRVDDAYHEGELLGA